MGDVKPRAKKANYEFHKRRNGDTITCTNAKRRVYIMSAFANWKRDKPGTLTVKSQKTEAGYLIRFEGISPAEATEARLSNSGDI